MQRNTPRGIQFRGTGYALPAASLLVRTAAMSAMEFASSIGRVIAASDLSLLLQGSRHATEARKQPRNHSGKHSQADR